MDGAGLTARCSEVMEDEENDADSRVTALFGDSALNFFGGGLPQGFQRLGGDSAGVTPSQVGWREFLDFESEMAVVSAACVV